MNGLDIPGRRLEEVGMKSCGNKALGRAGSKNSSAVAVETGRNLALSDEQKATSDLRCHVNVAHQNGVTKIASPMRRLLHSWAFAVWWKPRSVDQGGEKLVLQGGPAPAKPQVRKPFSPDPRAFSLSFFLPHCQYIAIFPMHR